MSWDRLSMAEKAEVMRIAVEGGVYDLDAIRNGYNEYAKGGNIYGGRTTSTQQMVTTGGAGYFPSMSNITRKKIDKAGNLAKAGTKAVSEYIYDKVTSKPDAERNAGFTFLKNLNKENQMDVLDAALHSTRGGEVMSSSDLIQYGLPNYIKKVQGKPMNVNYTGNQLYMDVLYPESEVNTKRDLVNLYLKGDTNGFEDVTNDPFYSNGADYKKYINQYYPGKVIKTYKMSSDGHPIYLNKKEIEEIRKNKLNKREYINEGWTKGGDNVGSMIRWYKDINGQLYAFDSDIWDFNPKDWTWEGDDNKIVDKAGTPFILKAARPIKSNEDKFYEIFGKNKKASGGKIHIKPENRGKFTALKKRTGHSATWFKQHGTPAQKKMATFALNARKWKHEDGGILGLDLI